MERMVLVGPQWQIDIWKTIYGESVDYIVSKPLDAVTEQQETGKLL